MTRTSRRASLPIILGAVALLAGCGAMPGRSSSTPATETQTAAPAPAASSKVPPGMNERGEVVDPTKVEGGTGQKVKGINDWEGEIHGKPVAGSKFGQLRIGMSLRQVTDIAGQPSDQGAYITGKAFIPFFFGSDRYRHELLYKGYGRLIFAGGSAGDFSSAHLIWIINSANEPGYR
jgi:hypothetical protein